MSPETPGRSPGRLGRLWARWRREPGEGAGQRGLGEAQIEALLRFSVAHPRWVVALSLALAVVSLLGLPRIHPRLDGRSLIPAGHPSLAASDAAAREFHLRDVLVVGLADPQGGIYQPHHLELLRRLSHGIANIPGVVPGSVASLATLPRLAIEADTLDTTPLLAGSGATSPETAARLRRETASLGLDDGLLVTPDGQATAIVAEVTDGADRYQVLGDLRRVLATAGSEGAEVFLSGTALAQATLGLAAARDLAKLVPGVILVLAVVLMVVFRHPVPALASLAEIGVSLTSTVGLLALSREPIFVTTLVLPVILIVIGVSDDVYALNHYFHHARQHPGKSVEELVVESFGSVARPILFTALTTIVGLLSLLATPLEPQRIFGLYGGFALLASTVATFTLVPAMLCLLRPQPPAVRHEEPEEGAAWGWPSRWLAFLGRLGYRRLVVALAAVGIASVYLARTLTIEDNWVRNLPPQSDIARGDRELNRRMAGTTRVEFLVESQQPDGFLDPEELARLGRLASELAAVPHVGAVESVFGDVVRVEAALRGTSYRELAPEVQSGRARLSRTAVEQALLLLGSLRNSPLEERIEGTYHRTRITTLINSASYSRIDHLLAVARNAAGGFAIKPFGDGWVSYVAVRLLVVGQMQSVGFALLANALLLFLLFRSPGPTLVALAPITLCVVAVFAVLATTGTPLGIANSMFAAIALGIGVDYSIHLVSQQRRNAARGLPRDEAFRQAFEATAPAIVKSATAISCGLAVLLLSEVLPNLQLGLLVCLSLTICAVATLLLVPALILSSKRSLPAANEPSRALSNSLRSRV